MKKFIRNFVVSALLILCILFQCSCSLDLNIQNYPSNYSNESQLNRETDSVRLLYPKLAQSVLTVITSENTVSTGFIINSNDGYCITSAAALKGVIANHIDIQAVLFDGSICRAELRFNDTVLHHGRKTANSDIAVIQLIGCRNGLFTDEKSNEKRNVPPEIVFKPSESLCFGDDCFSISTVDVGENYLTGILSQSIISNPQNRHSINFSNDDRSDVAFDGSFDFLIQTGLTLNPGNSGAPLFDKEGYLIGMMNSQISKTCNQLSKNDPVGISFATPSESLLRFIKSECRIKITEIQTEITQKSSIIVNSQSLNESNESSDRLFSDSRIGDSDYGKNDVFIVNSADPIVFQSQYHLTENGNPLNATEIAHNFIDKTMKIFVSFNQSDNPNSSITLSEGSGFVVTRDGCILTNLHVINRLSQKNQANNQSANYSVNIENINVYGAFEEGTVRVRRRFETVNKFVLLPLKVIGYHQKGDLALLKFVNPIYFEDQKSNLSVMGHNVSKGFSSVCELADQLPSNGSKVFAMGNMLAFGISISSGIVSVAEFTQYYKDYGYNMIQTDCPINSGNSGGPLFDASGKVVAVNTLGLSGSVVSDLGYEKVFWTIPSTFAKMFLTNVSQYFLNGKLSDKNIKIVSQTI